MENENSIPVAEPVVAPVEAAPVKTAAPAFDDNSKLFAILSYFGFWMFALLIKPENENPYVRNHIKNGIICSVLALVNVIPFVGQVAYIAVLVFAIMGIVKAAKNEEFDMPIFGKMFPTLNEVKVLSVCCYTSTCLFPLLSDKKDDVVLKSHINNGLWFLILSLVNCVPFVGQICYIVVIVFAIIGIVKACKGESYEFPVVGNIKIVK